MKRRAICLLAGLLVISPVISMVNGQSVAREVNNFDSDWKFIPGDQQAAQEPGFNDKTWRLLDIPHDWGVEGIVDEKAPAGGQGGYFPTGIGWYRKHFTIRKSDLKMNNLIVFDGVYMNSDIWVNGKHVGNYPFGYNSFYYNLDSFIKEGDNIIAVKVDNSQQPNSRWYSGSGIYRHVWLVRTNKLHIAQWGIYITTPEVSEKNATLSINVRTENSTNSVAKTILISQILDDKGVIVANTELPVQILPGKEQSLDQKLIVSTPKLWSVTDPVMYSMVTKIMVNGICADEVKTPFGIRSIQYDVDKGFMLNGKNLKLNGVCLHHDAGCLGSAVPLKIWENRLQLLKEMGCNAIRTSHNPPAPEFLDLCDRMGFLVMDEIFDEWKQGKVKLGYNIYFDKWSETDVVAMIRRDRNHPSIVLWSAGNEIPEQTAQEGSEMLKRLLDIFHNEDPTRPVTVACDNIAADGNRARIEFLNMLDIVGYNYVDRWHERRELYYSIDRHDHPDWKMIGTESSSNDSVRGDYKLGNDPALVSPNYNFRMIRAEQLWKFVAVNPYVAGDFMWTGIDYLGESRWPSKSASSGVIDLAGFPKDGFYFYQSQWTKDPMIHLFPHWNWDGRDGQVIPVLAYTNCDAVELFLNGKSFGEKRVEFPRQGNSGSWNGYATPQVLPTTADLHISWDVPYEPGILKAVGKKNGKIVCSEIIETTGKPSSVRLTTKYSQLLDDNRDVTQIKIEVIDSKGRVVPTADNLIRFRITGDAKIIGMENGNPVDHDPYKSDLRRVFNGLGTAIIKSGKTSGKVNVTASSEGLNAGSVDIVISK